MVLLCGVEKTLDFLHCGWVQLHTASLVLKVDFSVSSPARQTSEGWMQLHWMPSDPPAAGDYSIGVEICSLCRHHVVHWASIWALIDARSVSSLWYVSDTSRNKGVWCSPPPQFTAMTQPRVIARVSGLTWDSPDCHFWMFRSLLTRRPGARAVVCILMTDSHISIVLIPANIISTKGFISGREKKSNAVSSSHKSLVSSRESNCTEADFFFLSATKDFILLLIWWMSSVLRCLCLMSVTVINAI